VRLAGEDKAAGIRPGNLRLVHYNVRLTDPGHQDKPQEQGVGSMFVQSYYSSDEIRWLANVVAFRSEDVQKEGAQYHSSEWRTVPEKDKDYDAVVCSIVLNPQTGLAMSKEDATPQEVKDTSKSSESVTQTQPDTDQPVLRCTCCEWCRLSLQCNRQSCKDKVTLCIRHSIRVKEAAAADAKLPHCTDVRCFGRSGCAVQSEWGPYRTCTSGTSSASAGRL